MFDFILAVRKFTRNKALRICNIVGLSLLFSSFVISYGFIKYELSYDTFYPKADRIVRLSLKYGDPVDVRIYGKKIDEVLKSFPEIEQTAKLSKIETGVMKIGGERKIVDDFYLASSNFFEVFEIPLLAGDKESVLSAENKTVVSKSFAMQHFGTTDIVGKELNLSSRGLKKDTYFINGVYEDISGNSHFHSDILLAFDPDWNHFGYVYLLLKEGTDINTLKSGLDSQVANLFLREEVKPTTVLMPITDIHLHSNMQREHEINGNINYLYLLGASCILLFIIVLFNLWLTSNIMFLQNRVYYKVLYVNGAPLRSIFKQEFFLSMLTGLISISIGLMYIYTFVLFFGERNILNPVDFVIPGLIFLVLLMSVSLFPVFKRFAFSFLSGNDWLPGSRFTYRNARYMLAVQFCIVVFTCVVSLGIGKQLDLITETQIAGAADNILFFEKQPEQVTERYDLFKSEILKYSEIQEVSAGMQPPGSSILDVVEVLIENKDEKQIVPILVADSDLFKLYDVKFVAGEMPPEVQTSYNEEMQMFQTLLDTGVSSSLSDYYVLNQKAVEKLGFTSSEDAVGKKLKINHSHVGYKNEGIIAGVTENFMYTNVYENVEPLIVLQRKPFYSCFFIKYDNQKQSAALNAVDKVWKEVNPDYPCNYSFLKDRYGQLYSNENNIGLSVSAYSIICLIMANLGLIVFMAFMIRARSKEISIRKVNGASVSDILTMLNCNFVASIIAGFALAVPLSYYVLNQWLQNFAYKTDIGWHLYVLTGAAALLLVFIVAEGQAYRAATANPAKYLKTE